MRNTLSEDVIYINSAEQYKKQSYSTRAYILGANKVEAITVPVKKYANHELIKNIEIDYSENWNVKSWKTIQNAYRNSPYFEYFEDFFSSFFLKKYDKLVDLNQESLTICLKILGLRKTICQQDFSYYEHKSQFITFNAKERLENSVNLPYKPYLQNFGSDFEPNLSILDLLFQKGRNSLENLSPHRQIENI